MLNLVPSSTLLTLSNSGNPCKLLTVWKSSGLDCVSSCLTNYEYLVDATPYSEADLDNLQVGNLFVFSRALFTWPWLIDQRNIVLDARVWILIKQNF